MRENWEPPYLSYFTYGPPTRFISALLRFNIADIAASNATISVRGNDNRAEFNSFGRLESRPDVSSRTRWKVMCLALCLDAISWSLCDVLACLGALFYHVLMNLSKCRNRFVQLLLASLCLLFSPIQSLVTCRGSGNLLIPVRKRLLVAIKNENLNIKAWLLSD